MIVLRIAVVDQILVQLLKRPISNGRLEAGVNDPVVVLLEVHLVIGAPLREDGHQPAVLDRPIVNRLPKSVAIDPAGAGDVAEDEALLKKTTKFCYKILPYFHGN